MDRNPEETQYKVSDRRRFSAEGEPLEPAAETASARPSPAAGTQAFDEAARGKPEGEKARKMPPMPPATFELLVVSLAMQAQMELAGRGGPEEGPTPDLDLARHSIDLLGVLQEKTKGNLTLEESRLLGNTLTDLRFRYVQCVEEINKKAKA